MSLVPTHFPELNFPNVRSAPQETDILQITITSEQIVVDLFFFFFFLLLKDAEFH